MAKILEGRSVAAAMGENTRKEIVRLKSIGINPCLAIVRVGENEEDISYEKSAIKRCEALGIQVLSITFPKDVPQKDLLLGIEEMNEDTRIHGCLLLRPLPPHIDDQIVRATLKSSKDVDGITDGSLAFVFAGSGDGFAPCTAEACIKVLAHYGIELKGKNAVVVGRSLVIGKPVAMMLLSANATVTMCHTKTENIAQICRACDILVVSAGKQGIVGLDCFNKKQVVVDVGIHVGAEGKISGDIDFSQAEAVVSAITPVPGGVGAVTTAVLADHVVKAASLFDTGYTR